MILLNLLSNIIVKMSVITDTLSTTTPLNENELFQSPPTDLEGFSQI